MTADPAATPTHPTGPTNPDQPNWASFSRYAGIAAVAGFGLLIAAGVANLSTADAGVAAIAAKKRFALAYLSGFIFWFSLPIGGMALLMIAYLTKTSWGLLLRRPFEAATRTLPLFFLLFVPVILLVVTESASPYWWSAPHETPIPDVDNDPNNPQAAEKRNQAIQTGKLMIQKTVLREREERDKGIFGFLSTPSFVIVSIVLFLIWYAMIYLLKKWGEDASDETSTAKVDAALEKLKNFSGPGIIVYALTITAGATLWVMSLEPSWSSTMFPVIFAVNQFLTCFAFCLALFLILVSQPPFRDLMRPKFQLDMGTLMLVFTLFWSYTSFSQYMLVWIGNLPEEIPFFLKRSAGAWWYVSAGLIALHFALPFLLLLFRDIKLHPVRLQTVAIYLCVICAIDVVWWIEPTLGNASGFPYFLMDIGGVVGVGGLFALNWIRILKQRPLFPASQTFLLPEGHHAGHH
ncbi:MAG TPA: hypothetical protein VG122_15305 [Gemmata sp.]|nr:hypothetical protein [Gemmata sp.]